MEASARLRPVSLLSIALVVAALYLGRPVLMPLALALLLSFCLAPLVSRIERLGLGRVAAVVITVLALGMTTGALSWAIGNELGDLTAQAPGYRENLSRKVRSLREPLGTIGRAAGVVGELERELETPRSSAKPARVEVVEAPNRLRTVVGLVTPLAGPFTIAIAVAVLAIFLLIQREDLRDRIIRLAGSERPMLVTHAIDDIVERLTRYLGMMGVLCAIHGVLAAVGLYLLGIPGALAWGALAGGLRIVPYVGPWVGASVAVLLALAAFPIWMPALLAVSLFVALELLHNNVLEPWLYGTSAGLSPIAIVLSAFFWTWLWGLPGLFLATPLTVCLVVLGRFSPSLAFLRILFSEEPALSPAEQLYQRMLALDETETSSLLGSFLPQGDQEPVLETSLRRLSRDEQRGVVSGEEAARVRSMVEGVLASLSGPVSPSS